MPKLNTYGLRTVLRTLCAGLLVVALTLVALVSPLNPNPSTNTQTATAAAPTYLNFQARLKTSSGSTVPDGNYNLEFKIYDAITSGNLLWTETRTTTNRVRVANGYLTVSLGSVNSFPTNMPWGDELYITMNVGGTAGSPSWDGEMTNAGNRMILTAVPYAFRADKAATANNVASDNTNAASTNSSNVSIQSGNAAGTTSNSGNISIDTGTATGTTGTISLGATNASALVLGRSGLTTQVAGSLSVAQNLTVNGLTNLNQAVSINGASDAELRLHASASTNDSYILFSYEGGSLYNTSINADHDTGDLQFYTNGQARLNINVNGNLAVGTSDTTGTLLVLDTKTDSGDPTGANGGMYYNSDAGKFRCYEGGSWKDCIGAGGSGAVTFDGDNNLFGGNGALDSNVTGNHNIALGLQAMTANADGYSNVALGAYSLYDNNDGYQNIAIGRAALMTNVDGYNNTAIGHEALLYNSAGQNNIALGAGSMTNSEGGGNNIGIGTGALYANQGNGNVAIGGGTLQQNTTGGYNIAMGNQALLYNDTGNYNIALGGQALYNNDDGSYNVVLGQEALHSNTSGSNNLAFGFLALHDNSTGSHSIALGNEALRYNASGSYNIAFGQAAMQNSEGGQSNFAAGSGTLLNTTSSNSIAIGYQALYTNTSGSANIALGHQSLFDNTTGYYNVGIGYNSLRNNEDGANNIALGYHSLYNNTSGYNNVALGQHSLNSNQTGVGNVALGGSALYSTTGNSNIALGSNALSDNTSGNGSIAIGQNALMSNASGGSNVAIGYDAMNGSEGGSSNIGLGSAVMYSATGSHNIGLGQNALNVVAGNNNIAFGYQAGNSITSGANNIVIGYDADVASATGSNQLNIAGLLTSSDYTTGGQWNGTLTVTGATTLSVNGAASTPAQLLSGTWFTGGSTTTTKPQLLIQPTGTTSTTWDTSGTAIGVNAASGFNGTLLDLKVNNASQLVVDATGTIYFGDDYDCSANGCLNSQWHYSRSYLDITAVDGLYLNSGTDEINISPGGSNHLTVGTSDTTGTLLVLDTKTDSGDPTGTNGGMYYNSNSGKFRCYQAGAWTDCIGTGSGSGDILNGGNTTGADLTIGTNDSYQLTFETGGTPKWTIGTNGHFIPGVDDTYDIGSDSMRVRDLYLGPASLHIGASGDEAVLSYNTTTNSLETSTDILVNGIITADNITGENINLQNNGYLNFGAGEGSSGYGLRDNNGVLEVKDQGGSWLSLQSLLSSGGPGGSGGSGGSLSLVPQIAGYTSAMTSTNGTMNVQIPSGTEDGDLLVALLVSSEGGGYQTVPSGWTLQYVNGTSGDIRVFYRIASSDTPGSTRTWVTGGNDDSGSVVILRITGADPTMPFAAHADGGPYGTYDFPGITTTSSNNLGLSLTGNVSGGPGMTTSAIGDWTTVSNSGHYYRIMKQDMANAGVYEGGTDSNGSFNNSGAITFSILPASQDGFYAGVALLQDDFDDNTLDTAKWDSTIVSSGSTSESSQRIVLGVGTSGTSSGSIVSDDNFDMTNQWAGLEYISDTSTYSNTGGLQLSDGSGSVGWLITGAGSLRAWINSGGYSEPWTGTPGGSNAFMRIREASGITYWETSPDGEVWSTRYAVSSPIDMTDVQVSIYARNSTGVAGSSTYTFDNFYLGTSDQYFSNNTGNYVVLQGGNDFGTHLSVGTLDNFNLNFMTGGQNVLVLDGTSGAALFRNRANSIAAMQVQNTDDTSVFTVDTANSRVYIGNPSADSTGALLVLDTKNTAGDPTGVDGAMYYNSDSNKFRCYQDGEWVDCIGSEIPADLVLGDGSTAGSVEISDGTSNSVTLEAPGLGSNYTLKLPTGAGATGQCLRTDSVDSSQLVFGSCAAAGGDGGATSVGSFDSQTASNNGISIVGTQMFGQSASALNPGMVNTSAQSFGGDKTFEGAAIFEDDVDVLGAATFSGAFTAVGGTFTDSLTVEANLTVEGDIVANTIKPASGNLTIGTINTTGTLLVLDTKTDAGDPSGVEGGMYYNSDTKQFRCYSDSAWRDCYGGKVYLTGDVTETNAAGYTTIFTIPLTANKMNIIEVNLAQLTGTNGLAPQNRARISVSGAVGHCTFVTQTSATAQAVDNIAVATSPADTIETAFLNANIAVTNTVKCSIIEDASASDLIIDFQSEGTGTVTTKAGSYYTKTVN